MIQHRRSDLPQHRFCLGCGYALRGLGRGECPECGRGFDPGDPATTAASPEAAGHRRTLRNIARWLTAIAVMIAAGAVVGSATGRLSILLQALLVVPLAPAAFCLLVLLALPQVPVRRRTRVAGLLAVLVLGSVILTSWPLRLSFAVHRSAFDRLADQIASGAVPAAPGPGRVGILTFIQVRVLPEGNIGFQLNGSNTGGTYLVRTVPGSTFVWYNTNWEIALGGRWMLVDED